MENLQLMGFLAETFNALEGESVIGDIQLFQV